MRSFIPKRIWVVWPQFFLDTDLPNDSESLFEQCEKLPWIFLEGKGGLACAKPEHELSRFVLEESSSTRVMRHLNVWVPSANVARAAV